MKKTKNKICIIILIAAMAVMLSGCSGGSPHSEIKTAQNIILPEELKSQSPNIPKLNIKENERLFLSQNSLNNSYVAVLNSQLEIERYINNVSLQTRAGVYSIDEPLIVKGRQEKKTNEQYSNIGMGLYKYSDDKWLVSPEFDYLYEEDGIYEGIIYAKDEKDSVRACFLKNEDIKNEKILWSDFWAITDSMIWAIDYKAQMIYLYNRELKPVKTIKLDYEFDFVEEAENYIRVFESGGSQRIYNPEGELILDEGLFLHILDIKKQDNAENSFVVDITSSMALAIVGYGDSQYLYHVEEQIVLQKFESSEQAYLVNGYPAYTVITLETEDEEKRFYSSGGKELLSANGKAYSEYLDEGYLYYREDGRFVIESPERKETVKLPGIYSEDAYISKYLKEGIFEISDNDSNTYACYIVGKEGNKLYESSLNEQILAIYEDFFVAERGNYICVLDYEGNYLYKILSSYWEID